MTARPIAERFWEKVDKSGECWLWTSGTDRDGYGYFLVRAGKTVRAHRFSYQQEVGPIPDGLVIDHLCRVRGCVNPAHLEPVTVAENIRRGDTGKARAAQLLALTHCKNGHEWSGENVRLHTRPDGRTRRNCRSCERARYVPRAA